MAEPKVKIKRANKPAPAFPQLKNYEVLKVVGRGGMATVYKALQKSLNRIVAIKELKETLNDDTNPTKRFEREAIATSAMSHENIVSIYDFFLQDHKRYLVMEYVGGIDLATVLSKSGPLPIDIAAMMMLQIVRALEYIHAHGMVHRDIKPGNIMITGGGVTKLMDFGVVQSENWENLTMPGTFVGTPRYMSPEQIRGSAIDAKSDVFSIGIIFHELLTGEKLFKGNDKTEIFYKVTREPIKRASRSRPGLPWSLSLALNKCLKRDPKKRPTTQSLRRTLEAFLGDQNILTMRQRISQFLAFRQMVSKTSADSPLLLTERDIPNPTIIDRVLTWWAGPERYGLFLSSIFYLFFSLVFGSLIWWQSANFPLVTKRIESMAKLKVVAKPWANVYVNGRLREVTPFATPIKLHNGFHEVVLQHPELGERRYELPVKKGEGVTLSVDFTKPEEN